MRRHFLDSNSRAYAPGNYFDSLYYIIDDTVTADKREPHKTNANYVCAAHGKKFSFAELLKIKWGTDVLKQTDTFGT